MRARSRAALLWMLLLLFSFRVVGQAGQKWHPQTYLPSFGEFQGSGIPYSALLAIQLVMLAVMGRVCWRVHSRTLVTSHRAGRILRTFGGLYMAGSLARIVVGMVMPDPPSWFTAWIPAFFHIVLATFVLVVANYHLDGTQPSERQR